MTKVDPEDLVFFTKMDKEDEQKTLRGRVLTKAFANSRQPYNTRRDRSCFPDVRDEDYPDEVE